MIESVGSSKAAFDSLKDKRIYFAHMSVGNNIIEGVNTIAREHGADFNIKETGAGGISTSSPGLYHGRIGKNGNPALKISEFEKVCTKDLAGQEVDAAMMKLCYADITKSTDVDEVFDLYQKAIGRIRQANPGLKVIHVTVPLMAHQSNMKERVRNLVSGDRGNVKRNHYNEKIKNFFSNTDPVFDLAAIEASMASGKQCTFKYQGVMYQCMNPAYTNDGGHLNEAARKMVGLRFIQFLSESVGEK